MSELNIPDHWASIELGVLGKFINGYAFKSSDFIEKPDVQLVRMGNITPNGLNLSKSPVYLKRTIFENYPDYALQKNDILLTLTGTIDKEDFGNAVILIVAGAVGIIDANVLSIVVGNAWPGYHNGELT